MEPPAGKTWLTVELDTQQVTDLADVDIWDLDIVETVEGQDPEDPTDKANRLLETAERELREAARGFQADQPIGTGVTEMADACGHIAEALRVFREEL